MFVFSVFLIQGIQGEFKVPSRPNPPGCGIQDNQSRPVACGGTRATISECDKILQNTFLQQIARTDRHANSLIPDECMRVVKAIPGGI